MYVMMCDMCGTELEHHGKRYLLRLSQVPATRVARPAGVTIWDLCPTCAKELRDRFGEETDDE